MKCKYKKFSKAAYIDYEEDYCSNAVLRPVVQPIYLTQWKIVGNSEVHNLPYPDGVVLPNGYKRCEYLESDGTAYIEIPFGFDKTDEVYAKAAMLETGADTYFVSPKTWNNASNRFAMGVHNILLDGIWYAVFVNAYGSQGTSNAALIPYIVADNAIREWEYKNYMCSMGGSTKDNSNVSFGSETANLRLFYGYNTPTECKICEYRHKKANAEYRLIPCLDSNDTPCMYDVINNQAYYNSAGSGSFTYKLYPQPTEIWSCGEYNATDGKYHILVQPQGGSIADIALTEPLRKVNDVADTIEFADNVATVTRYLKSVDMSTIEWYMYNSNKTQSDGIYCIYGLLSDGKQLSVNDNSVVQNILIPRYSCVAFNNTYTISPDNDKKTSYGWVSAIRHEAIRIQDSDYNQSDSAAAFATAIDGVELIYELATPVTELVDAPQIEEADSYTCVTIPGSKALSWSSFETE